MANQVLKDIIADLGGYFGIRSSDAYLATLLGAEDETPWPIDKETEEPFARGVLLNNINAAGDTSAPTALAMLRYMEETGEDFYEDICITLNDDRVSGDTGAFPINALKNGDFEDQGAGKHEGDYFTIDDLRVKKSSDGDTQLHVIQVFPGVSNIATADTEVAALFLNAVPPLELSRAMPFLDVMAIGQVSDEPDKTRTMSLGRWLIGKENPDGEDSINDMLFNSEDATLNPADTWEKDGKKTAFRTLANMEIFTSPQTLTNADRYFNFSPKSLLAGDTYDAFRPFMSVEQFKVNVQSSGIGVFSFKTADLTLILHDKARLQEVGPIVSPRQWGSTRFVITYGWSHPEGSAKYGNIQGSRQSDANGNRFGELIDAMRVTETWQVYTSNFGFQEDGSVKIDLRLGLLGADGVDKLDITLPRVASMAKYIQKMLDEVKESIKSYRENSQQLGDVSMPENIGQISNIHSAMNMKAEDVKELLKDLRNRKGDGDMSNVESISTILLGKDGKGGALDKLKNLKENVLGEMITELAFTVDPWLRPPAYNLSVGVMGGGRSAYKKWKDIREEETPNGATADPPKGKAVFTYVSFGKVVTKFLGDALTRTGQFEEVQLIFHPLNESAGHYHGQNIASFPINISDLRKVLIEKFDNTGQMSLGRFLGFLNSFFVRDPGGSAYGFKEAFGERDPENFAQRKKLEAQTKKKGKEDDDKAHPILDDIRARVLKQAFLGPADYEKAKSSEGNVHFKMPQLNCRIETLPARDAVIESADAGPVPSRTILKIHIFDQAMNQAETLQDTFVAFAQSGIVNKSVRKVPESFGSKVRWARTEELIANQFKMLEERGIIEPAEGFIEGAKATEGGHTDSELKEMAFGRYVVAPSTLANMKSAIYKMSPTLIWGSMAGGIISGKWQSLPAGPMQSVMMLRQPGKEDGSDGRDGLPMQVSPTKASLETMGCPYFGFTQQYFIDFGTNTTADNFYAVTGITHNLSPGEFKTSVDMISMGAFGKLRMPKGALAETVLSVHMAKKKSG